MSSSQQSGHIWHYVDLDGEQQGPVAEDVLKDLWKIAEVDPLTLVWRPGQKRGWLKVEDIPSLRARLTAAPAAAAKPPAFSPPPLTSPQRQTRRTLGAAKGIPSSASASSQSKGGRSRGHKSALTFSMESKEAAEAFNQMQVEREEAKAEQRKEYEDSMRPKKAKGGAYRPPKKEVHVSGWSEHYTPERLPYYVNEATGDLSWDKPVELQTAEEKEQLAGEWVWMPHKTESFVPARVVQRSGGRVSATTQEGVTLECKEAEVHATITNFAAINMREDDLVQMLDVNEGTIIHCLRERFKRNLIYTAVGDILIAMNPYQRLPLYTPEKIFEYSHRGTRRLPPHVFDIASMAYVELSEYHKDISILISGESGAGKTEATKQVLMYLSEIASGGGTSGVHVSQKVLSANPALEAFGNAKTLRNNNSSRFGKFMQVFFDQRSNICGCNIENYLLEKSRVVLQLDGERNFHIFYQLCVGASLETRQALRLDRPHVYHYLNQSGCVTIDGLDDTKEFEDVETALKKLQFTPAEMMAMYKVTAAVLHCGNINFDANGEGSTISSESAQAVTNLAELLEVDRSRLASTLVEREIALRGEKVRVDLNVAKAVAGRDALAKSLYGKLFDWMVTRINRSMTGTQAGGAAPNYIGILDIFGFEIFKSNSFEQLCINFCNEKLQQHFNQNTFKLEEETYESEGIQFDHIEYIDNKDVLALIEKKPKGILVVLDDEVSVPRGSDQGFYAKICKKHKGNPRFLQPRMSRNQFVVNHYAGGVTYTIDDFLEKNKDRLEEDMALLMTQAGLELCREGMFAQVRREMEQKKKGGSARGTRYLKTQSSVFRSSLQQLMKRLNTTTPHYIRCVKTNSKKQPGLFMAPMCLEQLRYAGVFEAVNIRKQGFPFRFTHEDFYKRFRCVTNPRLPIIGPGGNFLQGCKKLLKQVAQRPLASGVAKCRIGNSMILYRSKQSAALELLRAIVAEKMASKIQGVFRAFRCRKLVREVKKHVPVLREAIRSRDEDKLRAAIDAASGIWFEIKLLADARFVLKGIQREQELKQIVEGLMKKDIESIYDDCAKILAEIDVIVKHDAEAFQDANTMQLRRNFTMVQDRREVKADLANGAETLNRPLLEHALKRLAPLQSEFGDFCPQEEQAGRSALAQIQKEEGLSMQIKHQIDFQSITGVPGDLNAVGISTEELGKCLSQAEGARTPMLKKAVKIGGIILSLRQHVKYAIASDASTKDKAWIAVQQDLLKASEAGIDTPEINLVKEDAAKRVQVEEIAEKLRFASETLDEEWLGFGVDQALRLHMDTHSSPSIRETVETARRNLRRIQETKQLLREGIEQKDIQKLNAGLKEASQFNYENDVVTEARQMQARINALIKHAAEALLLVDVDMMKSVIESCSKVGLELDSLSEMRAILLLPEPKLLQRQLKAAVVAGDSLRVTSITVRIKELFFEQSGGMFRFDVFPLLKAANLFAKRYGVHNDHLKRGMLRWTNEPIHTSLTRLESPSLRKLATRIFKNILGYMGDRQYSYPILLAQEVTRCGLENHGIRDEIYCQIVKQLIDNPQRSSVSRGWNLMALCLQTFPPSDQFENYLELFLRENHQDRSVRKLHKIVFGGAREEPIAVGDIEAVQHRGSRFSVVGMTSAMRQALAESKH